MTTPASRCGPRRWTGGSAERSWSPKEWAGQRIFLGFDGVDYYSSIWFNGKFLGDHEGMYGGPVVEVTSLVRLGQANEVVVNIHPGGTDEPGKVFKGYIFMKWHYLTDLSPRGIWQGARLVATGPVRLENPFVQTRSAGEKEAVLAITAELFNPGEAAEALITGTIAGENFKGEQQTFSVPSPGAEGGTRFHLPGAGRESQALVAGRDGRSQPLSSDAACGCARKRLGQHLHHFRHPHAGVRAQSGHRADVERGGGPAGLSPESRPASAAGLTINNRFMCRINGKLISMRGAGGFGAHDYIYRYHRRKDAWFIKAAQAMNFNFLRVHGSGIIAPDDFYDLCDRMGMMVWQEFMISNMGLSGVHYHVWRTQTVQSILRLRNHPSLVYWCGGNEFNPDNTADETKRIVDMFEDSVKRYDGTRPFSRAAQYVNDPHYNDQSGFYGGQKIAACSEYSGGYAGSILGRAIAEEVPARKRMSSAGRR